MPRRRWVYRLNEETGQVDVLEVGDDFTGAERRAATVTEELVYGGTVATDGTPIDTRKRHREYMKANGLAMASDFTNTWEKAKAERADFFAGRSNADTQERREALGRALHESRRRRR